MKNSLSKSMVLFFLALLFMAPGFVAYFFYTHPGWLGASTVNRGLLLNPPLRVESLVSQNNQWKLLLLAPDGCDTVCKQHMDTLSRVRLALGRQFYNVDLGLLIDQHAPSIAQEGSDSPQVFATRITAALEKKLSTHNAMRVFIANPDNYLVLAYPLPVAPDDVYQDLKRLLTTTQHKSSERNAQ